MFGSGGRDPGYFCAVERSRNHPRVARDTDRDFIMNATEAQLYGIIDEVITNRELAVVPQAAGVG